MRADVLEAIPQERAAGWPNMHPEDVCHRCGEANVTWYAPSPVWNQVMRAAGPDKPEPFAGIICPVCFAQLWELAFGGRGVWRLERG